MLDLFDLAEQRSEGRPEDFLAAETSVLAKRLIAKGMLFEQEPVPPREFFNDYQYAGVLATEAIWPAVREDMVKASEQGIVEVIFTGGQGVGKTVKGAGVLVYLTYFLGCMYDPCANLRIIEGSPLYICFTNTSKQKAKEAGFAKYANAIKTSKWFRDNMPWDRKNTSRIIFHKGIVATPVTSTEDGVLSHDMIGAHIDEANKLPVIERSVRQRSPDESYQVAKAIYEAVRSRSRNRFMRKGEWIGKIALCSEAAYNGDFVEQRIAEAVEKKQTYVYMSRMPVWRAKPAGTYSEVTFRVEVADAASVSRILEPGEAPANENSIVVDDVPEDFREDFTRDIDSALRRLGGFAMRAVSPLVANAGLFERCFRDPTRKFRDPQTGLESFFQPYQCRHPFTVETTSFESGERLIREMLARKDPQTGLWVPLVDPEVPRFGHIDFGVRRDALGIGISHPIGSRVVEETNAWGERETKLELAVYTDFVLQVVPPQVGRGEVQWDDVKRLIAEFVELGFDFALWTMDRYNNVVPLQDLQKMGFAAEEMSMDTTAEPYLMWRQAVNSGRLWTYRYAPATQQALELEWWTSKNKVDHPRRGAKDVCDAWAGSVVNCLLHGELSAGAAPGAVSVVRIGHAANG